MFPPRQRVTATEQKMIQEAKHIQAMAAEHSLMLHRVRTVLELLKKELVRPPTQSPPKEPYWTVEDGHLMHGWGMIWFEVEQGGVSNGRPCRMDIRNAVIHVDDLWPFVAPNGGYKGKFAEAAAVIMKAAGGEIGWVLRGDAVRTFLKSRLKPRGTWVAGLIPPPSLVTLPGTIYTGAPDEASRHQEEVQGRARRPPYRSDPGPSPG